MREPRHVDQRRLLATIPLMAVPNFVAAVLVFLFQNILVPDAADTELSLRRALVTFVLYLAVSFPAAGLLGFLLVRPTIRWLRADRRPTPEEVTATVTAPRRMAALAFSFWLGGLLVFGVLGALEGDSFRSASRDAVATLLGGLTSAMLAFLLVESWMRPIVADALAGAAPPRRRTAGVAPRILLSWALGSGVPMLAIAMAELRVDPGIPPPTPEAILFLALLGAGSGALLLALAAKSVAQPIAAVRTALRRVQDGEVDVEVPVDDAGQIGQLQAGFNEMVQGLRERRHLEDLFGRYVGPEVAADALARGVDLGGETREVSALFVDIIDSTEFTHGRDPAEVVAALNEFFDTVVDVVSHHGGWVNKFEGDGALCVFGAPADQPDHASSALRAARELHHALGAVERRRGLRAGIGVSTGKAVAGHVGAVERFEYTIIGDPVNEAARLTEAAKDTETHVLASGPSFDAASPDEQARWKVEARLSLRGRATETAAYSPAP